MLTNKPEKIASETRNFPGRIIVANMARDLKDWFLRSGRNLKIFPITIRNHQNLLCRKFNLKVVSAAHIRTNVIYWFLKVFRWRTGKIGGDSFRAFSILFSMNFFIRCTRNGWKLVAVWKREDFPKQNWIIRRNSLNGDNKAIWSGKPRQTVPVM